MLHSMSSKPYDDSFSRDEIAIVVVFLTHPTNPVHDQASKILQYIIETLFIIHGEIKPKIICLLGGDFARRYGRAYNGHWRKDLKRQRMPQTTTPNQDNPDMLTSL